MNAARLLACLLLAIAVTGCARQGPPAEVVDAQNALAQSAPAPTRAPLPPTETAGGRITVKPGQTLYAVARDANVPVRALIDANQLQPPYKLREGQMLVLPRTRQHIVQPGETLYAVARQYGVEASTLARENHLNPPYTIKSGAVLMLPAPVEPGASGPVAVAALPPPQSATPPSPPPSTSSAVSVAPLPPLGKPSPPVGPAHAPPAAEPIHLPTPLQPATNAAPPPQAAAAPAPQTAAVPPPQLSPEPTPPPAKPAPQAQAAPPPAPAPDTTKPDTAKPSPAPEATGTAIAAAVANHPDPVPPVFQWPVRGRIVSVFGTSANGAQNDGINILAPTGTTVSAADGGTVAYAGNELRGFGNLLLIKHADGWVTAYAHNEVLLVKKGDKVRRGQPIARVGTTGGVAQAQLHFELRRGTKAIDPLDHLPQQSADAG